MNRFVLAVLIVAVAALAAGCGSSTEFVQTWKDPGLTKFDFKKAGVLAIAKTDGMRRTAEDAMAAAVQRTGMPAVPLYTLVSHDQVKNADIVKSSLTKAGIDGLVIMRMVATENKTTYVPGSTYPTSYYSPWGYHGYGWGAAYDPGYMVTNKYVNIETNIYDLKADKLVWSGISESVDPSSVNGLVMDVSDAAYEVMYQQGLVKKLP